MSLKSYSEGELIGIILTLLGGFLGGLPLPATLITLLTLRIIGVLIIEGKIISLYLITLVLSIYGVIVRGVLDL